MTKRNIGTFLKKASWGLALLTVFFFLPATDSGSSASSSRSGNVPALSNPDPDRMLRSDAEVDKAPGFFQKDRKGKIFK